MGLVGAVELGRKERGQRGAGMPQVEVMGNAALRKELAELRQRVLEAERGAEAERMRARDSHERLVEAERGQADAADLLAQVEAARSVERASSGHLASTLTGMVKSARKKAEWKSQEARDMVAFQKSEMRRAEKDQRAQALAVLVEPAAVDGQRPDAEASAM